MREPDQPGGPHHEEHAAQFREEGFLEERAVAIRQRQPHPGNRPQEQGNHHGADDPGRTVHQQPIAGDDRGQHVHDRIGHGEGGARLDGRTNLFFM